jgi:hypothetical protein
MVDYWDFVSVIIIIVFVAWMLIDFVRYVFDKDYRSKVDGDLW